MAALALAYGADAGPASARMLALLVPVRGSKPEIVHRDRVSLGIIVGSAPHDASLHTVGEFSVAVVGSLDDATGRPARGRAVSPAPDSPMPLS